jgi:hypothetical protein
MGEWRYSSIILNHGTTWRWMVSFMLLPLYSGEETPVTHWLWGWVGSSARLDVMEKRKISSLTGNWTLIPWSSSPSLQYHDNTHLKIRPHLSLLNFLPSPIRCSMALALPTCLPTHLPTYLTIYLWLHSPCGPWPLFQFLNLYIVGRTHGRGMNPSQSRYLHNEQHKHRINAHRHPCLKWDSNPRSQCSSGQRRFMP